MSDLQLAIVAVMLALASCTNYLIGVGVGGHRRQVPHPPQPTKIVLYQAILEELATDFIIVNDRRIKYFGQ